VRVGGRHLALPIEDYDALDGFGAARAWIRVGTEIGAVALPTAWPAPGSRRPT